LTGRRGIAGADCRINNHCEGQLRVLANGAHLDRQRPGMRSEHQDRVGRVVTRDRLVIKRAHVHPVPGIGGDLIFKARPQGSAIAQTKGSPSPRSPHRAPSWSWRRPHLQSLELEATSLSKQTPRVSDCPNQRLTIAKKPSSCTQPTQNSRLRGHQRAHSNVQSPQQAHVSIAASQSASPNRTHHPREAVQPKSAVDTPTRSTPQKAPIPRLESTPWRRQSRPQAPLATHP
jgi:hypothetical protein